VGYVKLNPPDLSNFFAHLPPIADLTPMNRCRVIVLFFLLAIPASAVAQIGIPDSIKTPGLTQQAINLKAKAQLAKDSLQIDGWAGKLKSAVSSKFNTDSLSLSGRMDSLRNAGQPIRDLQARMDSLTHKKDQLLSETERKKEQLLSGTKSKLEKWKSDAQSRLPRSGVEMPGGVPGLPTDKIPNLKTPDLTINSDLPNLPSGINTDQLGGNLSLPEMPELSTTGIPDVDLSPDLSSISEKVDFNGLDKLNGVQDKIGGATEQIGALKNISSNPDQAIESTVKNIDQLSGVQDQLEGVEAIRDNEFVEMAEKMKDPEAMKAEVKEIVVQKAVDHFAGKEQVLQQAMNQLSKYKQKYESLNSLSDIKNLPKNAMKGKSFRERFVPGVAMQFLRNNDLLLDINPYAGYRITGRLNAGLGWNQRIGFNIPDRRFTSGSVIYGPRTFVEVRTWRGFIARAEAEVMNTEVPSTLRPRSTDEYGRQWVRTVFVGVKKNYNFLKNIKGTTFIMFSVYNDHRKSPYGDVVNSRFGFEFPMKKKTRK
jgi:hypothetical protein